MQKSATVAVINNNKILLLKRGISAPYNPGRYCLPGGKVEENEDLTYAASRELSEETGISVAVDSLTPVTIQYTHYSKTVFVCSIDSDRVILDYEHDDYVWVDANTFIGYPLVPGLNTTINTLIQKGYLTIPNETYYNPKNYLPAR